MTLDAASCPGLHHPTVRVAEVKHCANERSLHATVSTPFTELLVVVGAGEFGGINGSPFQGQINLTSWQHLHVHPQAGHHLASQAGDAHLEALQVVDGVDLFVEPAAHLNAGIAARNTHDTEVIQQFLHQRLPTCLHQPCVLLPGGQAKWNAGVEGQRGVLADVVVRGALADLNGPLLRGVEDLEAGNKLPSRVASDVKQAVCHRLDALGHDLARSV